MLMCNCGNMSVNIVIYAILSLLLCCLHQPVCGHFQTLGQALMVGNQTYFMQPQQQCMTAYHKVGAGRYHGDNSSASMPPPPTTPSQNSQPSVVIGAETEGSLPLQGELEEGSVFEGVRGSPWLLSLGSAG